MKCDDTKTPIRESLSWRRGRWHLHGRPIHAGAVVYFVGVLDDEGGRFDTFHVARFESRDTGHVLVLCVQIAGLEFSRHLTMHDPRRDFFVVKPHLGHIVLVWEVSK